MIEPFTGNVFLFAGIVPVRIFLLDSSVPNM